ncbi:hypothetical protein [Actinoplanes cyaneus]|uniref:hypothetical protein n=1 Tax=Actinoplanes cyaneus TaxID=52696 RepID=UPI001EF34FBF|nr:hypothetical protein [Actinoplanes cyaneus]
MTSVTGLADAGRPQTPVAAAGGATDALGATDPLGAADPGTPGGAEPVVPEEADASAATGVAEVVESDVEHAPAVRARATAVAAVTHLMLIFRIVLSIS